MPPRLALYYLSVLACFDFARVEWLAIKCHNLKRWAADGKTQELTPVVDDLQEPARPTSWIAADLRLGKVSDHRQRLIAGGGPARQFDAFVVGQEALSEAEMEKVAGHGPSPSIQEIGVQRQPAPLHFVPCKAATTFTVRGR